MSDAVESAGESGQSDRPAKRQKQHNETEAFGRPMDDEETARRKLEEAGFDPDKPLDDAFDVQDFPMTYFCGVGDLRMCRYLLSKGASTTQSWVDENEDYDSDDDDDDGGSAVNLIPSPMFAAARNGHFDICKWLFEHGARGDIRKGNAHFFSPLSASIARASGRIEITEREKYRKICRWLILNEALFPRDNALVSDPFLIKEAFAPMDNYKEAPYLLRWADEEVRTHNSFMTFLMGTYLRNVPAFTKEGFKRMMSDKFHSLEAAHSILASLPEDRHQFIWEKECKAMNHCDLQCLSGHPGIRKHIADLLGVKCGRDLRIMRELERTLRAYVSTHIL